MFENILGHEREKKILMEDIEANAISHAYAFCGPKGIGKRTLAQEFAKTILKTDNLASNTDYTYVSRIVDKKDIMVGQVRENVIDNIYIRPAMADYKVYIVDEADTLNIQAQNALLKTLEEPPSYVVIILITESMQSFLPTIISRVKEIKFNVLGREHIDNYLRNNHPDKNISSNMLNYINGSLGKLELICTEEEIECFQNMEKIAKLAKEKDSLEIIKRLDKISFKNTSALNYLQHILFSENMSSKVFLIENVKKRLYQNGNEDIIKTKLAIDICR